MAKDRSHVALRVRFMVDGDADGSAGGGEGEEEEAGGGGGEPGGVAMVLFTIKLELVNIIKNHNMSYVNQFTKIKYIIRKLH